jgi:hypothetical protein
MGQTENTVVSFADCATVCNFLQPVHVLTHVFSVIFYFNQLTPVSSKESHEICGLAAPWFILLPMFIITRQL